MGKLADAKKGLGYLLNSIEESNSLAGRLRRDLEALKGQRDKLYRTPKGGLVNTPDAWHLQGLIDQKTRELLSLEKKIVDTRVDAPKNRQRNNAKLNSMIGAAGAASLMSPEESSAGGISPFIRKLMQEVDELETIYRARHMDDGGYPLRTPHAQQEYKRLQGAKQRLHEAQVNERSNPQMQFDFDSTQGFDPTPYLDRMKKVTGRE